MCVCIYIYTRMCAFVCVCVCVYIYIYIYIYTHTYKQGCQKMYTISRDVMKRVYIFGTLFYIYIYIYILVHVCIWIIYMYKHTHVRVYIYIYIHPILGFNFIYKNHPNLGRYFTSNYSHPRTWTEHIWALIKICVPHSWFMLYEWAIHSAELEGNLHEIQGERNVVA